MAFNKRVRKNNNYLDNIKYKAEGTPSEGAVEYGMSTKALKGMPKSAYAVLADPYEASIPTASPYPILTAFNRKVGGEYAGSLNLDGGNVLQYANSVQSDFLKIVDFMRMKITMNYRYKATKLASMPTDAGPDDTYVTSGLIDQARSAIAEAISVLQSTTFTNMAIWDYVIITDMAMGKAKRSKLATVNEKDGTTSTNVYGYTNITDVLYAALTYYQIVLQDSNNMINWINSFRLKEGTMIRSAWNREAAILNGLFAMFNKKAFLGQLDGICLQMPGEYIDVDWIKQTNMINSMPSRRSNAMFDPVLELQTRSNIPSVFKLATKIADGVYSVIFDQEVDFKKKCVSTISTSGDPANPSKKYFEAIDDIMDIMSAQSTMQWARNAASNAEAGNARFNEVKYNLDVVQLCITTFKTLFNDVRDTLDTLARTGLNTWSKGFRPSIVKDTDAPLFDNSIVNDIFKTVFAGADSLEYNPATKRWRFFTLWNMYNGIPEYDAKVGGCFLSFSSKTLDYDEDLDLTRSYLPVAFCYGTDEAVSGGAAPVIYATSRDGVDLVLSSKALTMSNQKGLRRLVPLPSQSTLKIRVPYLDTDHSGDGGAHPELVTNKHKAYLDKTLVQVFGVSESSEDTDVILIDPDIISIYQIEIQDITNDAISYARLNGPFKGAVTEHDEIGFSKFGGN